MANDTDFQKRSTKEGRLAQEMAKLVVSGAGFEVAERNKKLKNLGVTINYICVAHGQQWYFDVSGALSSDRAGLIRTDTMWKTLGRANVLAGAGVERLILLTTNLPKRGSVGDTALHCARATFFDAIEMLSSDGKARLRAYAATDSVTRLPGFWTAQEVYGDQLAEGGVAGANLSLPLEATGDPLGSLHGYAVTGMTNRLKVYLPSQTRAGLPISTTTRQEVSGRIKAILSAVGGGCTSQEAKGSWIDPFTGVVDEDVDMIETYSAQRVPDEQLHEIVELIVLRLDQEAAAVVLDGEMLQFSR